MIVFKKSEAKHNRTEDYKNKLINVIITGWPEKVSKVQDAVHILTSETN